MAADRAANVAIIAAFSALPIIGIMGLAVDYALATSTKSKLDAAADTAVIAATTKAKAVVNAGGSIASAISQGQAQGLAAFRANAGALSFADVPTPTVTIVPNGQQLTATVTYSTPARNQFGGLFNVASTAIRGTSSSATVITPYYQFIFIVDISGSMAIGGTSGDIAGLNADPKIKCAFACHDPNFQRGTVDYRVVAKADGWTLKIDYVNQALQNFMQDLQTQTASIPGVFSVGIYTFGSGLTALQPPTTAMSDALQQAKKIDIEPMQAYSVATQGYTQTTTSLNQVLAATNTIGDGSSASQQKTFFILLSDGVEDVQGNMKWDRSTDLSYATTACKAINASGAKLITILAPYPVVNDDQYPILVAPLAGQLGTAMQQCASDPTLAYQATDGPGINTAVHNALQQILQGMTRLTQ